VIILLSFLGLPLLVVGAWRAGEALHLFTGAGEGPATLAALAAQEAGLLGLTLASVKWGYGRPWRRIGLTGQRWGREAALGLLAAVPLYLVQEAAMKASLWGFRLVWPAAEVSRLLAEENAALAALVGGIRPFWPVFGVLLVLLAPLAEEVFFRGFVQEVFRERLGPALTAVSAALLFAVIHRYVVQFLPVFLVGLSLSVLYEWRRSLTAGVAAHAALNLAALLGLLKDLP
jgi:membrane protease YdiL (CAAX protease family)